MIEIFTCYTLVDITCTGVNDPVQKLSYNQFQNFNTLIQCIGLRSSPENLYIERIDAEDMEQYQFGSEYTDRHTIWKLTWNPARTGYVDVGVLEGDCCGLPIYSNLEETANFPTGVIETKNNNNKNTYFTVKLLP